MPEEIKLLKTYSFNKNNITGNFPIVVGSPSLCDFSFFNSLLYGSEINNDSIVSLTSINLPTSLLNLDTSINLPTSLLNLDESCICENLISVNNDCYFSGGSAFIYFDDISSTGGNGGSLSGYGGGGFGSFASNGYNANGNGAGGGGGGSYDRHPDVMLRGRNGGNGSDGYVLLTTNPI